MTPAATTERAQRSFKIGEVAELTGTTPRTIRYYEEFGVLPESGGRELGKHRTYAEADVERLREVVRLKDLLGLSLGQLKTLVAAQDARAALRRRWHEEDPDAGERRRILEESLGHIATQLGLVGERKRELDSLESELTAKRRRLRGLLRELED